MALINELSASLSSANPFTHPPVAFLVVPFDGAQVVPLGAMKAFPMEAAPIGADFSLVNQDSSSPDEVVCQFITIRLCRHQSSTTSLLAGIRVRMRASNGT